MRSQSIALILGAVLAGAPPLASSADAFDARLEWVPISGAERNDVAGEGAVTASLSGEVLTIRGSFTGLPAAATAAKVFVGVATGARGRGAPLAELDVTGGASGMLAGEVRLGRDELAALRAGRLYIELYSEKGVLPDHATLWGWLVP